MGKKINLLNKTFGELFVLRRYDEKSWVCLCSCGKEKIIITNDLTSGRNTSCGHIEDLSGRVFGYLTVTDKVNYSKDGRLLRECLCVCGKKVNFRANQLKRGEVKSCGCFRKKNQSIRITEILKKKNNKRFYFYDKDKKIYCDSSYEVFVWNYYAHICKINIIYSPKSINTILGIYNPDFYLPEKNLYIETKGTFEIGSSYKQKEKINLLNKNGYNIKILFWEDIRNLCNLKYKSDTTYFRIAKRNNLSVEYYLANILYEEDYVIQKLSR